MNKLIIKEGRIILDGFNKINSNEITFAFYPTGVVIFLERKKENRPYYFSALLKENKIIENIELLNKLKERNIIDIDYFVETSDSYIQMNPS